MIKLFALESFSNCHFSIDTAKNTKSLWHPKHVWGMVI